MKNIDYFYLLLKGYENKEGCIIWDRGLVNGYPEIHRKIRGHRLALENKLGRELLEDMSALHTCHNTACINPLHLYEGNHMSNMQDMREAKRQAKGKIDGNAVLNDVKVLDIKSRLISGERASEIAKFYEVAKFTIHSIKFGKSWAWLTGASKESPLCVTSSKGESNPFSKLKEQQVGEIKRLLLTKELTHEQIANRFCVSRTTIGNIKRGKIWAWVLP